MSAEASKRRDLVIRAASDARTLAESCETRREP
jgi:hypothetical protein